MSFSDWLLSLDEELSLDSCLLPCSLAEEADFPSVVSELSPSDLLSVEPDELSEDFSLSSCTLPCSLAEEADFPSVVSGL